MERTLTYEEFLVAAKDFIKISDKLNDGWELIGDGYDEKPNSAYLKKQCLVYNGQTFPLKAEYVVFYNLSYGVPSFSFNMWNSSGELLTLEDIRNMAIMR